jgi:uncharacterized protein (DUF885 family)
LVLSVLCAAGGAVAIEAQQKPLQMPPEARRTFSDPAAYVPDLSRLSTATSELRDVVERLAADRQALMRFYNIPGSAERRAKLTEFYRAWLQALPRIDFARLSLEGQADHVLLRNYLEYQLLLMAREDRVAREVAPLVPFVAAIVELQEQRQNLEFVTAEQAAAALAAIGQQVAQAQQALDAALAAGPSTTPRMTAVRAAQQVDAARNALSQWHTFYNGYDPAFTAKAPEPYQQVTRALTAYAGTLRQKVAGLPAAGADAPIVGDPIGRQGLLEDLAGEMIVYTPEQLIEIGNREYAWCEAEMKKASRELGYGDDWMKALEHVKNQYVPAGGQPALIRNLALEAEAYLKAHDLVSVPALASDIWRMQMMTPERQRVNPFFTGGETISVSYPTNTMSEADAMMSMRGNGVHVSRATVQHELIPGHHLKGFMSDRYNAHRRLFSTPFMGEGWALYWELLLWDHGFPRSPEDRIGMLWWRMHRAARIIFSLNFHLGRWTPEQCVDFLVNRVGHERFTATGEVRRSFEGNYSPLYQAAYMMGGLQIRGLARELVEAKKMTPKQFHDAILEAGSMPIEILRAQLERRPLARDYKAQWLFYGEVR